MYVFFFFLQMKLSLTVNVILTVVMVFILPVTESRFNNNFIITKNVFSVTWTQRTTGLNFALLAAVLTAV